MKDLRKFRKNKDYDRDEQRQRERTKNDKRGKKTKFKNITNVEELDETWFADPETE